VFLTILDGYGNKNGLGLTQTDSVNYIKFMADEARQYNMSIGLKNADSILPEVQHVIQFAVNEECAANNECNVYEDFLRTKPVFHIEYTKVKAGENVGWGSLAGNSGSEVNAPSSASAHDAEAVAASPASPALPAMPAKSETASTSSASTLWNWLSGKKDKGTAGTTSATTTTSTTNAPTASAGGWFSSLATGIGSGLSAISSGVSSLLGWNKLGLGSKTKPQKRQDSMFKSALVDTEMLTVGKYCTPGNTPNLGPKFSTVIKVEALDGWVRFCDGSIATTRILTADVPQKGRYAGGSNRDDSETEQGNRQEPEQSEVAAPKVPSPEVPAPFSASAESQGQSPFGGFRGRNNTMGGEGDDD
jgi:hypothetical protein